MSEQDSPASELEIRFDAEDASEPPAETLTDLFDRIEREAFRRSLAHRHPVEPNDM